MKFLYTYRTKDNVKCRGALRAASKADAYELLKAQGIRPERVDDAPGLFNKMFGKGKRWLAIGFLSLALIGLLVAFLMNGDGLHSDGAILSSVRRQPIGDAGVIDYGIKTGWKEVFEHEGDRFLASFAIPGVPAGQRFTTEDEFRRALSRDVRLSPGDGIEARQIKAMVSGLKAEISKLLCSGWTIAEVGKSLTKRQDREVEIFNRARKEIEEAEKTMGEDEVIGLWKKRNDELRKLGIKTIPLSE